LLTLSKIFLPALPIEQNFCHLIMSEISKLKYKIFTSKHLKQFIKVTIPETFVRKKYSASTVYVTLSLRKPVPFPPLLKKFW
jgi:hypothetical protein